MTSAPYLIESVLLSALERLNTSEPAEVVKLQARSGRSQPELTAFILAAVLELRREAAEVGLFAMLVLYEAFRSRCKKVQKARERVVAKHWKTVRAQVAALRVDVDSPIDLLDELPVTSEPVALRYVIEALTDADAESVVLTDAEIWSLLTILKTAIETLHEVANAPATV
jgi:hypothetical protein